MDPAEWGRELAALCPDMEFLAARPDGSDLPDAETLTRVRYLVAWKPSQKVVSSLPALEAIFYMGAGVDHLLRLDVPDVPVVRSVDEDLTRQMTEYVVWQVLHHHRQAEAYRAAQAGRRWEPLDPISAPDVGIGILGLGVLGTDASEVLKRLGFHVMGWSRTPKVMPGLQTFSGEAGLAAMLPMTDILVSILPLTEETCGLLNRDLFATLRKDGPLGGPVLINAGRGGSQVDADIAAALRDGTLKGASLDVFETEPLPAESPLWDCPNLVITPHVAASSDAKALSRTIAGQINAHRNGEPLRNIVDVSRGY
ncbi:2-hydroxyacid dehydrogenase [Faunimonas pinastri]